VYAVLFQVDVKPDWHGDADAELDELARTTKELPGFVRATWASNDTKGAGLILVETEDVARGLADNAVIPPEASVSFRSVDVLEVRRDV
jgi:hypothetical protein